MEDEKAPPTPPAPKAPSQMKLVIVGALLLFVALVGAQVAVPLINGMIAGSHATAAAEGEDEEIVLAEGRDAEAVEEEEAEEEEPLAPALYAPLDPPFVVSFEQAGGARYVQMTLQAMARSEETVEAVKQHSPAIRNAILFLVSGYDLDLLTTQAGKEQLRKDLLVAANEILAKNGSEEPIEELFFTSLVIQ